MSDEPEFEITLEPERFTGNVIISETYYTGGERLINQVWTGGAVIEDYNQNGRPLWRRLWWYARHPRAPFDNSR